MPPEAPFLSHPLPASLELLLPSLPPNSLKNNSFPNSGVQATSLGTKRPQIRRSIRAQPAHVAGEAAVHLSRRCPVCPRAPSSCWSAAGRSVPLHPSAIVSAAERYLVQGHASSWGSLHPVINVEVAQHRITLKGHSSAEPPNPWCCPRLLTCHSSTSSATHSCFRSLPSPGAGPRALLNKHPAPESLNQSCLPGVPNLCHQPAHPDEPMRSLAPSTSGQRGLPTNLSEQTGVFMGPQEKKEFIIFFSFNRTNLQDNYLGMDSAIQPRAARVLSNPFDLLASKRAHADDHRLLWTNQTGPSVLQTQACLGPTEEAVSPVLVLRERFSK